MKLLSTPFSPFSRKVLVLAHEKGVRDRIDTVLTEVGTHVPLRTDVHDRLSHTAPLMKIPVLIDGSQSLFDSRVICEYLDGQFVDPRMFPDIGPARWDALRQQALADGIMDAAIFKAGSKLLQGTTVDAHDGSAGGLVSRSGGNFK
jgi:glutathione S-transferase